MSNKLAQYSAMSVSFLLLTQKNGSMQVIYTDLDPDGILELNNQILLIDLDDEGSFDFGFLKTSGTVTTTSNSTYFKHADWIGPYYEPNQIAGSFFTTASCCPGTYFPYKLNLGELISDENQNFYNGAAQQLASLRGNGIGIGEFAHDTTDGYVGVKFIDESKCYHYGWIRLAVVDSCRKMIIKDYAYEVQCDHPILTGSKEHYVSVAELPVEDIQIYASNNQVFVNFQNGFLAESFISIYNTSAEKIYGAVLNASENIITLDHPPGMYVVEVRDKRSSTVKTILLQ